LQHQEKSKDFLIALIKSSRPRLSFLYFWVVICMGMPLWYSSGRSQRAPRVWIYL